MDHPMSDYLEISLFQLLNKHFKTGSIDSLSDLTNDREKVELSKGLSSIQDIEDLAHRSFTRYSDAKRFPKGPQDLLSVTHSMKAAQNHESTIALISKALSQIADSLPRVELITILYPTDRIRKAVSNLYASLVRFFIRAHEWCQEGTMRHLWHSITQPPELRYQDLLEDITVSSREIDQLAAASGRVEIRDISLKLDSIVSKLNSLEPPQSRAILDSNQTIITKLDSFQALHSSALLDTNQRLSDLQFSQIMSHISEGKLGDPLEAFRYNVSVQIRHDRVRVYETTNDFWQSPKLQTWSTASESSIAIVKGSLRARHASRKFTINIIQQLQSKNIPVVWALRGAQNNPQDARASTTDLFKHLILQSFKLSHDGKTESTMSLQCAQFHRANTENDWLQLLGSALLRAQTQIYLVIDLAVTDHNLLPAGGFSWFTAFQTLFAEMVKRSPQLRVKVLLVGNSVSFRPSEANTVPSDVVVPIKVTQTPVRRRGKMGPRVEAYGRRGYPKF
ncbi:unnamed protein product [Fusarium equiseti]|uniref:DUF7708 domain-containing protein n=1 Tax=Fusarium equiseti TaxID=61235 RepID=A0A8J2NK84_FUSEQ|nr:unnamed protein product [Fusarium equiseti]